jgi:hypothetical protein
VRNEKIAGKIAVTHLKTPKIVHRSGRRGAAEWL